MPSLRASGAAISQRVRLRPELEQQLHQQPQHNSQQCVQQKRPSPQDEREFHQSRSCIRKPSKCRSLVRSNCPPHSSPTTSSRHQEPLTNPAAVLSPWIPHTDCSQHLTAAQVSYSENCMRLEARCRPPSQHAKRWHASHILLGLCILLVAVCSVFADSIDTSTTPDATSMSDILTSSTFATTPAVTTQASDSVSQTDSGNSTTTTNTKKPGVVSRKGNGSSTTTSSLQNADTLNDGAGVPTPATETSPSPPDPSSSTTRSLPVAVGGGLDDPGSGDLVGATQTASSSPPGGSPTPVVAGSPGSGSDGGTNAGAGSGSNGVEGTNSESGGSTQNSNNGNSGMNLGNPQTVGSSTSPTLSPSTSTSTTLTAGEGRPTAPSTTGSVSSSSSQSQTTLLAVVPVAVVAACAALAGYVVQQRRRNLMAGASSRGQPGLSNSVGTTHFPSPPPPSLQPVSKSGRTFFHDLVTAAAAHRRRGTGDSSNTAAAGATGNHPEAYTLQMAVPNGSPVPRSVLVPSHHHPSDARIARVDALQEISQPSDQDVAVVSEYWYFQNPYQRKSTLVSPGVPSSSTEMPPAAALVGSYDSRGLLEDIPARFVLPSLYSSHDTGSMISYGERSERSEATVQSGGSGYDEDESSSMFTYDTVTMNDYPLEENSVAATEPPPERLIVATARLDVLPVLSVLAAESSRMSNSFDSGTTANLPNSATKVSPPTGKDTGGFYSYMMAILGQSSETKQASPPPAHPSSNSIDQSPADASFPADTSSINTFPSLVSDDRTVDSFRQRSHRSQRSQELALPGLMTNTRRQARPPSAASSVSLTRDVSPLPASDLSSQFHPQQHPHYYLNLQQRNEDRHLHRIRNIPPTAVSGPGPMSPGANSGDSNGEFSSRQSVLRRAPSTSSTNTSSGSVSQSTSPRNEGAFDEEAGGAGVHDNDEVEDDGGRRLWSRSPSHRTERHLSTGSFASTSTASSAGRIDRDIAVNRIIRVSVAVRPVRSTAPAATAAAAAARPSWSSDGGMGYPRGRKGSSSVIQCFVRRLCIPGQGVGRVAGRPVRVEDL
ncbi:hypothetical protein DFJ73DRAFT_819148, partial [Zopfochytrium polystomum]